MVKIKEKTAWQKVRKFFNDIHLWMGIASGIIIFLVCLSGTIYTFSHEIQEMLEPEKFEVEAQPGEQPLPVEQIVAAVLDSLGGGTVQFVSIPADKSHSYQLNIKKDEKEEGERAAAGEKTKVKEGGTESPGNSAAVKGAAGNTSEGALPSAADSTSNEKAVNKGIAAVKGAAAPGGKPQAGGPGGGRRNRGTTYLVNPYTAEVLGTTDGPASEFFMSMFRLHRWLLLDIEVGRPIVGWATVIFFFIVLSGLVIWFPQKIKSWRQGLKIKFSGNWKRINHDLHNTLGFYSSFLLLVMALTGLTWSFEWYKEGFNSLLGVEGGRGRGGSPVASEVPASGEDASKLSVADYLAVADQALPYEGDYRLSLPSDPSAAVSVSKNKTGFFAPSGADRIQLDQYSGKVLEVERFSDKGLNEQIASSVKALHTGEIFGTFSKILYFISCLVATSLPVTGTIIWINKLRKKKPKKGRKAEGKVKAPAVAETY